MSNKVYVVQIKSEDPSDKKDPWIPTEIHGALLLDRDAAKSEFTLWTSKHRRLVRVSSYPTSDGKYIVQEVLDYAKPTFSSGAPF